MIKFEGIIEGECINKKVVTNYKDLDFYYSLAVFKAGDITQGYNKTWITILINDKPLLNRHRIDLYPNSNRILKYAILEEIEGYINYMKRIEKEITTKELNDIDLLKNAITSLHEFNDIKTMHQYEFYHKSKKVHEYTLTKKATETEIKTTLEILAGVTKGYGIPLNVDIAELKCISKDIILQF